MRIRFAGGCECRLNGIRELAGATAASGSVCASGDARERPVGWGPEGSGKAREEETEEEAGEARTFCVWLVTVLMACGSFKLVLTASRPHGCRPEGRVRPVGGDTSERCACGGLSEMGSSSSSSSKSASKSESSDELFSISRWMLPGKGGPSGSPLESIGSVESEGVGSPKRLALSDDSEGDGALDKLMERSGVATKGESDLERSRCGGGTAAIVVVSHRS